MPFDDRDRAEAQILSYNEPKLNEAMKVVQLSRIADGITALVDVAAAAFQVLNNPPMMVAEAPEGLRDLAEFMSGPAPWPTPVNTHAAPRDGWGTPTGAVGPGAMATPAAQPASEEYHYNKGYNEALQCVLESLNYEVQTGSITGPDALVLERKITKLLIPD